jgi:hypothetical protein
MALKQRARCRWAAGVVLVVGLSSHSYAADRLAFWNLTASTITNLQMSPAGTEAWSANQCANDPDGGVDADERLKLTGIEPGRYDVKLTQKSGPTCIVRNVEVKSGGRYAFAISEQDLKDCRR